MNTPRKVSLVQKSRPASIVALLAGLVAVLAVAGCGGGGGASLSSSDVAAVGETQITKQQFDDLMATAEASYKQRGQKFPKQGTSEYQQLKSQAVTLLVQQAEREQKAKDLGVEVTDKQIEDRLKQIKQQYFGGKEATYKAQLKKQGLSDAQVRADIKAQLISEAIFKKVTADVKVSDSDVHKYYTEHTDQYKQPASRQVRHILVKKKALADQIYSQLKGGGDFAKLAKKYSIDTVSAQQGGNYEAVKGRSVAPFDKVAFALKTKEISRPVQTQYGWHVIQALSAIKPAGATPEKQASAQIKQQLLSEKKNTAVNDWSRDLQKDFCKGSEIKYQTGFKPSPDPCASLNATTSTSSQ